VALAKSSGNALVFDLVSMIRSQLEKVLPKVLLLPNAMPLSTQEHAAIVKAIERGNADAARKAMHGHLQAVIERYADADKQAGARGAAASNGKSAHGRAKR
jgi:GntR family transcriptional repressor for pyruvate dehydrogenase complex